MATRKKGEPTALALYEQELAEMASQYASQEANTGGGQFFSIAGGVLQFGGQPVPNNEMAVIVLDSIIENVFYAGRYDPDNSSGPACYAFGRSEGEMHPHANVDQPVADSCEGCPNNEWGSADTGRGKACRNRRRLALVSAGKILRDGSLEAISEPAEITKGEVAYLSVPPTSLTGWGQYVKQITGGALRRPPHGVFTRIAVVPDTKTQVKVTFELLGPVPNNLLGAAIERHKEIRGAIDFPYPKREERAQQARGRAPVKGTSRSARSAPSKPAQANRRTKY